MCEKTGKYVIPSSLGMDAQLEPPVEKNSKLLLETKCKSGLNAATKSHKEELFITVPCFGTTCPYPLLPSEWYEKIGIEKAIEIKAIKDDKYIPLHRTEMLEENAITSLPYPLLPVEWYKKVGKEVENGK